MIDGDRSDRGWHFRKTVTVGNLFIFVTILAGFVVWYTGQQARIDSVQRLAEGNRDLIIKMVPTLERIDRSMDLLTQQFGTFPLHRHVPGDGIIYAAPPTLTNSIKAPRADKAEPFIFSPPKVTIFSDGVWGATLPKSSPELKEPN